MTGSVDTDLSPPDISGSRGREDIQSQTLASIINAAKIGLVLLDRAGVVHVWNDWVAAHSGIPASVACGQNFFSLFPELSDRMKHAINGTLKMGTSSLLSPNLNRHPLPLFDRSRNGELIEQHIDLRPIRFPDQKRGCLIHIQDVTADMERARLLQAQNETLRNFSFIDALTGLPNRRRFDEHFEVMFRMARRHQRPISIALVDVDYFKRYNDSAGHLAGDRCLQQVGELLQTVIQRPGDLIARYGGEEFIAVLPDTELIGGVVVAERLREVIESAQMSHPDSPSSAFVTLSVGVASTTPGQGDQPNGLIEMADRALYRAKQRGRNRVVSNEEYLNGQAARWLAEGHAEA